MGLESHLRWLADWRRATGDSAATTSLRSGSDRNPVQQLQVGRHRDGQAAFVAAPSAATIDARPGFAVMLVTLQRRQEPVGSRGNEAPVTASSPSKTHRLTTRFMTCTTAISSAANNSTLAKRATVVLLNHRNQPTDTKHDREIAAIPQNDGKQGAEKKLCPRSPARSPVPFSENAIVVVVCRIPTTPLPPTRAIV
jgi:hypothetical protein